MKNFEEIQIGDRIPNKVSLFDTFHEFWENEGVILDKGSFDSLVNKGYHNSIEKGEILQWLEEEELEHCVAVSMDPNRTFERNTSEIFIYGIGDPCYVYIE